MIDIQALAKEACLMEDESNRDTCYRSIGVSFGVTEADLGIFAALILEAAAVECEYRKHAGESGAFLAAEAIRALKPEQTKCS